MADEAGTLDLSVTIGDSSFSANGSTAVVLDAYEDFKKLIQTAPARAPKPATPDTKPVDAAAAKAQEPAAVKAPTDLPLKPYLAQFKLSGNKEKATAVLAWSAESGGEAALTITEIEALMKKGGFKAPANLSRDVRKAETEGWLDSAGKGPSAKFSINGYGEDTVAGWVKADEKG